MAKRGQGEGTISKRPDGTWWARITLGKDENGKQKRRAFYGKTRAEVQQKLTAALNDVNNDKYIEPSKMTLAQWLEAWMKEYKRNYLRASSFYNIYQYVHGIIIPRIGSVKLKDMKRESVQRFINGLIDDGYKATTVKVYHGALSGALKQAYENGLIADNPAVGSKLPLEKKEEKRVFTQEEQAAFVKVAKDSIQGQVCIFILCTGLRIGECLALEWNDIDFIEKTVRISKTITVTRNPYDKSAQTSGVAEPKTQSGNRTIPLLPSALVLLEIIKANQIILNDKIFCNAIGEPIKDSFVRYYLRLFLEQIGIDKQEKFTVHSLRHTFATRGLENGIELRVMQELLGHASMSMTADLYTHVLPEKKKESMMKMEGTVEI